MSKIAYIVMCETGYQYKHHSPHIVVDTEEKANKICHELNDQAEKDGRSFNKWFYVAGAEWRD